MKDIAWLSYIPTLHLVLRLGVLGVCYRYYWGAHFNSALVRLEAFRSATVHYISSNFNSALVRLEGVRQIIAVYDTIHFNSALVRLEVQRVRCGAGGG